MEEFNLILLTVLTSCCFKVINTVPQADVSLLDGHVAIKGSTVQLVCRITDYTFTHLAAWTVNSDVVVVRCLGTTCISGPGRVNRYTYSRDTSGMYLNISNLNRDVDQKFWKCLLQQANPTVTAQLNLTVYTSPVGVTYNNPLVTNQDLTVHTVTLTCETTQCASPAPAFTWYYMNGSTRVQYTDVQSQGSSTSQSCVTPEFRYRSTLTLPRYTACTGNIDKTAQFVCGATHPALSDDVYTGSSVQVTFAVHVESVTLKDGSNTPRTDTNIQVEENTVKTLTVEFSPVNSRPGPTITCYVGTTSYTVSTTNLQFTFTPRDEYHGQSVHCEAYNRGVDTFKVTSNMSKLYVKVYVTSVVIKDGSILQTGEDLTVEENTSKSLTVEYQPSFSRPAPTVTCYLGTSTTSMSGSTFTFTPSNSNHGDKVYCQAANRDDPSVKVTSGMPLLYIKGKPFDPDMVVAGAHTGAVISLVWSKGCNGGHDQTFVIEYQLSGADAWTEYERVKENDMTYILPNGSYYTNITGLSAGEYSIRFHATNEKGQSGFVNMTNIIIEEDEVSTTQSLPIAAIAGGAAAGICVILVVAVVVFLVRRNSSKDVINVNDQYVSAGTVNVHQNQGLASSNDEYATVNKPQKQQPPASETYAVVDKRRLKKKSGEKESPDTQQQAENIYENPGGSVPSQSASPKPRKNQDGLIYIEVEFSKDKKKGDKKPVNIHGLYDQTTYAEVAIGKRGTALPESDEEDHASSSK